MQAATTNRTTHSLWCLATWKSCPKSVKEPRVWMGSRFRHMLGYRRAELVGTSSLLPHTHQGAPANPCKAGDPGSFATRWVWIQPLDQGQWICKPFSWLSTTVQPRNTAHKGRADEQYLSAKSLASTDTLMPRGALVPALQSCFSSNDSAAQNTSPLHGKLCQMGTCVKFYYLLF